METTNFEKEYGKVTQILLKDLFKNGLYNLTEWQMKMLCEGMYLAGKNQGLEECIKKVGGHI